MHQKLLLVKENKKVETVKADTQPFHTSSNCVETQRYQENVGPINIKESLEDSLVNDQENVSFGLCEPVEDGNVV